MTKVTLTWQQDNDHSKPYNEDVDLETEEEEELSIRSSIVEESSVRPVPSKPENISAIECTARIAAALTLDNCIDELVIMTAFINEPLSDACHELFEYKCLQERFTLTPKAIKRIQEEVYESLEYTDWQKFQDDICFACTTLRKATKEIEETGLFPSLLCVIYSFDAEEKDIKKLKDDYHQLLADFKYLKKQLSKEKEEEGRELQKTIETIGELKNAYEDVLAYGKKELNYLNKWEGARRYQHDMTLTAEEDVYNNCIEQYTVKSEFESRIHGEIENFILENTEDLQNSIQYWMQHYDEEIERREAQIMKIKMELEALCDDHIKLQELYEEHRIAIEEWLAYKEEKRRQAELRQLRMESALIIQRWWRTQLVIKKIGPFKPKRGKGKGKGKDKDKGKKK